MLERNGTLRCRSGVQMRKILLAFLTVIVIVGACGRSDDSATSAVADTQVGAVVAPEPEPAPILGEERKPIVAAATKDLRVNRDKIEKISFYLAKNPNVGRPRVEAYVSLPDDMQPILRMRTVYFGDDWVFYKSIKVMVDDAVIYERDFNDVARDNSGGSVWETADFPADARDLLALHAIAGAKSATIRFSGREHRHDHEITVKERKDIKKVLEAYEQLSTNLVRKREKTSA
jgi:hypothetical protein